MSSHAGQSQKVRDFLALTPFLGFTLYTVLFSGWLFWIFSSGKVNTEDQATLVLITAIVNQGFNLLVFMAGFIYFRPSSERAPFRKDDLMHEESKR